MADLILADRRRSLGLGLKRIEDDLFGPGGLTVGAHTSISEIPSEEWDALYPGSPEGYALYCAFEDAPPAGFRLGAVAARHGRRIVAAAPLFRMSYRLDTPFQGRVRAFTDQIHARVPGLMSFSVIGLGSPMSDNCNLAFASDLTLVQRQSAMSAMLDHMKKQAKVERHAILAIKSIGAEAGDVDDVLQTHGFGRMASVPLVMLPLTFQSLDHYLASLPRSTADYFRRKMRSISKIHIEYRDSAAGIEMKLAKLYASTLSKSSVSYGDFEELHPDHFGALMGRLGDRARLMLCWRGEDLLSFQIFLVGKNRIVANKIGMKYPEAREYNLYFINWMKMIEFAIEKGVPEIEMGATTYSAKLLFGGHLDRRWLYFRFRGDLVNQITRPLHRLFDFERNDPELRKLRAEAAAGDKRQ